MKDVQCYELFRGIALKNHAFSFLLDKSDHQVLKCSMQLDCLFDLSTSSETVWVFQG